MLDIVPSAPGMSRRITAQPRRAAVRAVAPGEVEPVGVDSARERVAADDVDLDLLVLAPEADDAVAGNRVAALRRGDRRRPASAP